MAKSKNYSHHNQNRKNHRNGIKKPKTHRHASQDGMDRKFLKNLRFSKRNNKLGKKKVSDWCWSGVTKCPNRPGYKKFNLPEERATRWCSDVVDEFPFNFPPSGPRPERASMGGEGGSSRRQGRSRRRRINSFPRPAIPYLHPGEFNMAEEKRFRFFVPPLHLLDGSSDANLISSNGSE